MQDLTDIALTDDGDIILGSILDGEIENTDIALVSGVDHATQSINFRLRTNLRELFMHEEIGNELIEVIGKTNTRETAEQGKRYIINAITKNNFIAEDEVEVTAIPVDVNTIVYSIAVTPDNYGTIIIVLEVDLKNGIRRVT
jgi:phage baseplate assembly protein W